MFNKRKSSKVFRGKGPAGRTGKSVTYEPSLEFRYGGAVFKTRAAKTKVVIVSGQTGSGMSCTVGSLAALGRRSGNVQVKVQPGMKPR